MTFLEDLREQWGEDADDILRDLASHGADSGWPGLTYYSDTVALYDKHEDEIWDALEEDTRDLGVENELAFIAGFGGASGVGSMIGLKNLLVWYMAEREANNALVGPLT